jgi:hypothetical protein
MGIRVAAVLANWVIGASLLFWPRLAGAKRRLVALVWTSAGLLALVLAIGAEGSRQATSEAVFLLGQTYVTGFTAASASLPFYALTVLCLAAGFVGLALREETAHTLAHRWWGLAVATSLAAVGLRFTLEAMATPVGWARVVGVTPLAPVVGALFALSVREEDGGFVDLLRALCTYAWIIRGAVAALTTACTLLGLGTHFDLSPLTEVRNPFTGTLQGFEPHSFRQLLMLTLVPQLLIWPVYTVLVGLLAGALVWSPAGPARARANAPGPPAADTAG